MRATLRGGPYDGEAVNLIGTHFVRHASYSARAQRYTYAIYLWAMDGEDYIGVFKGFWSDQMMTKRRRLKAGEREAIYCRARRLRGP